MTIDDMSDFDRCVHRVLVAALHGNPGGLDTRMIWQRLVWTRRHGGRAGEPLPLARIRASLARLAKSGHAKQVRHFGFTYWMATDA